MACVTVYFLLHVSSVGQKKEFCANGLKSAVVFPCWCSAVKQRKTYCYENHFVLPNMPTLLTVISDVIGDFCSTSAINPLYYLAALQAGGILPLILIGTYPHSFSFCINIHPDCSMSHHIWNSLVCCGDNLLFCQTEQSWETGESTKEIHELVFRRRNREMWLFIPLSLIQLPFLRKLDQFSHPYSFLFTVGATWKQKMMKLKKKENQPLRDCGYSAK